MSGSFFKPEDFMGVQPGNLSLPFEVCDVANAKRDAEIERLRGVLDRRDEQLVAKAQECVDLGREAERLEVELERLRAENERLRDSLHTCHAGCTKAGCVNARLHDLVNRAFDIINEFAPGHTVWLDEARAALEGK